MSGFQSHVNQFPAPGVEGGRASNNPYSTVVAGNGALISDGTVRASSFGWVVSGIAYGYSLTAATPDGFVANEDQALITTYLAESSMILPEGFPVTMYDRGDFWARSVFSEATIGQKVYANLLSGKILTAATGAFPVTVSGGTGVISVSGTTAAGVMTVTATSVYLAPGMLITDPTKGGYPPGTYISSQVTGSAGGTGTYQLTTLLPVAITAASTTVVATAMDCGGSTTSACSCDNASPTLTVTTRTNGNIYVGQRVSGTSIPTGTYVSALGTYNDTTGTGTLTLSANATDTITGAAVLFSPWIETPWYVKSNGNVGDLIKIGIRN
jgi:hypothetical protein